MIREFYKEKLFNNKRIDLEEWYGKQTELINNNDQENVRLTMLRNLKKEYEEKLKKLKYEEDNFDFSELEESFEEVEARLEDSVVYLERYIGEVGKYPNILGYLDYYVVHHKNTDYVDVYNDTKLEKLLQSNIIYCQDEWNIIKK